MLTSVETGVYCKTVKRYPCGTKCLHSNFDSSTGNSLRVKFIDALSRISLLLITRRIKHTVKTCVDSESGGTSGSPTATTWT